MNTALRSDFFTKWLVTSLNEHGCVVKRDFFNCKPCDSPNYAYYDRTTGVVVCENNVNVYDINSGGRPYFYANLRHELVHAFDNCRAKMTPNTSDPNFCKQIACSEIRASSLSTECHWNYEKARNPTSQFTKGFAECVKRRATLSLSRHPTCADRATQLVASVFDACMADNEPFGYKP
mmetsp:Transcript_11944/g.19902  ORF Transcript_11944/g.19902 Transcript_11944/m.19902 type:complete len:178 (-) Transcript_11944:21-554(-)